MKTTAENQGDILFQMVLFSKMIIFNMETLSTLERSYSWCIPNFQIKKPNLNLDAKYKVHLFTYGHSWTTVTENIVKSKT